MKHKQSLTDGGGITRNTHLWWACITLLFLSIRPQAWRHWVLRPLRPRRVDCSPGHSVRWDRDLGVVLAKRAVAGHEHVLQLSGGINENELCLLKAFLGQLGICWAQRVRVPLEESTDWTYQYQRGCANEMHATTASPRRMLTCAMMMVLLASILLELTTNEVGVSDAHTRTRLHGLQRTPTTRQQPLQLSKSDVALLEQVGGQCP